MKILVRNVLSGELLKADGDWTLDVQAAKAFSKSSEAFAAALKLAGFDLEVLLCFDGLGSDVHIPVSVVPPARASGMDVMVDPGSDPNSNS